MPECWHEYWRIIVPALLPLCAAPAVCSSSPHLPFCASLTFCVLPLSLYPSITLARHIDLLALQQRLADERAAAIKGLDQALGQIYATVCVNVKCLKNIYKKM